MELGNGLDSQQLGKLCFVSHQSVVEPSCSQKENLPPTVEGYRMQFYETYCREAKDYDEEFIKKYDEDLDTTLIFVRCARRSATQVLIRLAGWSVFRRNLCVYHRGQLRTQA